jgi:hypothetical protein
MAAIRRPGLCSIWLTLAILQGLTEARNNLLRRLSSNYRRNNNGYTSYNHYGGTSSSNFYGGGYYNGARDFSVCDDSVVKVLELYILCDSPYTFYYGNGASRHSPFCTYGDKISFEVRFTVTDDIQENEPIYTTIAIYDDKQNVLTSTEPTNLCEEYVGNACTNAGYYTFSSRMRLPYPPSETSKDASFLPQMHIAFSTQPDFGYNLGAMNIECEKWDSSGASWLANKRRRSPLESFMVDYGLLVVSCLFLSGLCAFVWRQAGIRISYTSCNNLDKSSSFIKRSLGFIELD